MEASTNPLAKALEILAEQGSAANGDRSADELQYAGHWIARRDGRVVASSQWHVELERDPAVREDDELVYVRDDAARRRPRL